MKKFLPLDSGEWTLDTLVVGLMVDGLKEDEVVTKTKSIHNDKMMGNVSNCCGCESGEQATGKCTSKKKHPAKIHVNSYT